MTKRDERDEPRSDETSAEPDDFRSPTEDDSRWREAAQRSYEASQRDGLITEVVFAIADAKGVDPTALKSPNLYDTVDLSAIEHVLFGGTSEPGDRRGTGRFEFRYGTSLVEVRSDGWVRVFEPVETGPS